MALCAPSFSSVGTVDMVTTDFNPLLWLVRFLSKCSQGIFPKKNRSFILITNSWQPIVMTMGCQLFASST